jgi:putative phosphoesterase
LKRILLLSDTHGYLDEKILKYLNHVDEVWHAGDIGTLNVANNLSELKPLRAVYGNIDGPEIREKFKEDLNFFCEGLKICITHIGGYPGKYNSKAKKIIEKHNPKIFICGHSHILKVIFDKKTGLLHMNPGACGVYGFHRIRTMLKFNIDNDKIENLQIIELAKK